MPADSPAVSAAVSGAVSAAVTAGEAASWRRVAAALRRRAAGDRPVCAYLYDLTALRDQACRVRGALPAWCEIYYAVKANSHPAVLRTLATLVDGFEVASLGELHRVRRATTGLPAPGFVFSGPGKTDTDLEGALRAGVDLFNVEGFTELRRLAWLAERLEVRAPVALRVNPRTALLSGSHRMTGTPSQFGIDEARLADALALVRSLPALRLRGLHFHAVSNNIDAGAHARFVKWCLDTARRVADEERVALPVVDVGGGLGVDYTGGPGFDVDAFGRTLAGMPPASPDQTVVLEPGRLVAAGCGYYAAEVLDVKRTHDQEFAVVRGGIHHFRLPSTPHAPECGHPFRVLPVEEWRYPFPRPEARDTRVTIAGELCTPRDVLAREAWVERLRAGDLVVFPLAGAYGWEISHHDFLVHPHPEHLVVE